jgi:hypothetical protein
MALAAGDRLGVYQVLGAIGSGGTSRRSMDWKGRRGGKENRRQKLHDLLDHFSFSQ